MQPYLNQSHSEADSQDHPDVGEEPALHAGSTALMTNSSRLMWSTEERTRRRRTGSTYHIVYGPVGRLSLTEAAVREVSAGERDVLARAGEQQLGAVDNDHVPGPVLTTGPATALHLQTAKTQGRLQGRVVSARCQSLLIAPIFWLH